MINLSLAKIEHPLNQIPETPVGNFSEPDDFESHKEWFNSDCLASESDDMEDNNDNNEERGNTTT
jgi:hypothetical protein